MLGAVNDGAAPGYSGIRLRSSVRGRHRLWIAGLYRNVQLERELRQRLSAAAPKHSLSANLITGTLLVCTDEALDSSGLIAQIETVLHDFSQRTGTPLFELERRGRQRPVHLSLEVPARRRAGPPHVRNGSEALAHAGALDGRPSSAASGKNGHAANGNAEGDSVLDRLVRRAQQVAANVSRPARDTREPSLQLNLLNGHHRHSETEPDSEPESQIRWHTLDGSRVGELLRVDPARGLSAVEIGVRTQQYGPNELPQPEGRSGLARFFGQFKDLPVLLLAGSAVLSCVTGGVVDGVVILTVIVANGVIGYVTESSAERTIASLTRHAANDTEVLRAGEVVRIALSEVVPGDIVVLRMGSVVPADARLLEASDLSVDESALTGESLPADKSVPRIDDADLPLGDRRNMVYRGTLVTGGGGRALVVATGAETEVGRLQAMVGEVKQPETPMQRQLRELGERTMVIASVVCGGVFAMGILRGNSLLQMLRTSVSLAVAAVPEGLPTVAITTLAIGIQRMKQRQVIVRRLDAIETLGSVQVLCFDKTGTITYNRMRVLRVAAGGKELTLSGKRLLDGQSELAAPSSPELEWLLRVGALCSEVTLRYDGEALVACEGSPTEKALVEMALELGMNVRELRGAYPRHSTVERTETRRLMATIHRRGPDQSGSAPYLVAVKGSPEDVLDLCRHTLRGGQLVELSDEDRRLILRENDGMSSDALRVLGLAYREHESEPGSFDQDLIWLGLTGLADPPREGLPELIAQFRTAGVRSVMITGDQSATAYAVAKQIGLAQDGELQTLDSIELDRMNPELLAEIVPNIQVFSRVSPRHKLRIVQALQKSGLVVAMTGDGINDCPALKAADVGVAMGGGKSPVAREVADVILETDDLHAMLIAIEQGRVIHADIKKAVRFILATNLSEILLTLLSVAVGFGESMSPLQLLWINLVSDIFPELALALQPSEDDVLQRPPREPGAKMFSKEEFRQMAIEGSVLTAGAFAAYAYGISRYGQSPNARALSFVTLTAAQLLHAFSTRSERHNIFDSHVSPPNPYVPLSVGGGIALTLLIQLIPATRKLFGSRPLPAFDWLIASLGAAAPLVANEITKAVRYAPSRIRLAQPSAAGDAQSTRALPARVLPAAE
jgi:Ca2+-transporting ATPase